MPRKRILTWDKSNKCWTKQIKGKRYYLGKSSKKTDQAGYEKALEQYKSILEVVNDQPDAPEEKSSTSEPVRDAAYWKALCNNYELNLTKSRGGIGLRPPTNILGVADAFHESLHLRLENRKISPSHVYGLVTGLTKHFLPWIGYRCAYPDSLKFIEDQGVNDRLDAASHKRLKTFRTQGLLKNVTKGKLSPHQANIIQTAAKEFLRFAWRNKYINELPRYIDDPEELPTFRVNKGTKRDRLFSVDDAREMYSRTYGYTSNIWQPTMRAMILLAANCCFSVTEVATLCVEEIDFERGRITRVRDKTGVTGSWKLWDLTLKYLKVVYTINEGKWLNYGDHFNRQEKVSYRLFFRTQQNRPMAWKTYTSKGLRQADAINKRFLNLKNRTLEDKERFRGIGFGSFRHLSATTLATNPDIKSINYIVSLALSHGTVGYSTALKYYVKPQFDLLDEALEWLRTVYDFESIEAEEADNLNPHKKNRKRSSYRLYKGFNNPAKST